MKKLMAGIAFLGLMIAPSVAQATHVTPQGTATSVFASKAWDYAQFVANSVDVPQKGSDQFKTPSDKPITEHKPPPEGN